ncbi:MAG: phenylacetate--CoA ligase family protein [Desulfobacterales bacterium]|uniref:Phenylacetate--CoA ligase family protein n=1 Tax=Candidatus Desulfatibia vada TaxID=2841696 RepID=A0A8J6TUF0_9BACT|nr:phenylacetate--CoA ligase family protein [Candidatus Desulfatibia vada]
MIKFIIDKFKSKPLWYLERVMNPLWWMHKIKINITANKIASLLYVMHENKSKDWSIYRDQQLSAMLKYAYQHCPYYEILFEKYDVDINNLTNFENLPLLDKTIVRKHKKELISCKTNWLDTYTMNTGGSTGEPLEFIASQLAATIFGTHLKFLYKIMGYRNGDKIASFDGSSIPEKLRFNNIYWIKTGIRDIPWGSVAYSSLYLTSKTIPLYIDHILNFKPSILRGYPSFISDIANYIIENKISIPFQVKGILLTSENAFDWQVENIKKAFNTNIYFEYGISEVCVCGYTVDNTYEYACSPFYGFTEILDTNGRHVKKNEIGEIVVTGYFNYALPFIRYKTGDLAVYNVQENGIVKLRKIIGRTQDFIYTIDKEKVALTAIIFGQHYRAFKNIERWQLEQNIPGEIIVRIVKGQTFSNTDEQEIKSKFKTICNVNVDCEYVDCISLTNRGKFKFLIQNIN